MMILAIWIILVSAALVIAVKRTNKNDELLNQQFNQYINQTRVEVQPTITLEELEKETVADWEKRFRISLVDKTREHHIDCECCHSSEDCQSNRSTIKIENLKTYR